MPASVVRGVPSSSPSVERCAAERTEHGSAFSLAGSSGVDTLGAPPPPPPSALVAVPAGPDAAGFGVPMVVVLQPARASATRVEPGQDETAVHACVPAFAMPPVWSASAAVIRFFASSRAWM